MTWLWITVFMVACGLVLTGYVYAIEIRGTECADPALDGETKSTGDEP